MTLLRTLADYLPAAASRRPEQVALIAGDEQLTYAETEKRSRGVAQALLAAGVQPGDRVMTLLPNGIDAAVAIHGAFRARAALVPLAEGIKADRLAYLISDVRPTAVICDAAHRPLVEEANRGGLPLTLLSEVTEPDSAKTQLPVPLADDLAAVLYTSGSTGRPKGVMLSHHNLHFVTGSIVEYLEITAEDRILCVLQLSFGYGLSQLLCCAQSGGTLVLEPNLAMAGSVVQALERHRVTGLPGVPTIFHVLTSLSGLAERELPDLRFLSNAGAALPASTVRTLREVFPRADIYSMYGLTECIRGSYLEPGALDGRPTSSGKPIPGTEAWIRTSSGAAAGPGEIGELVIRGPHVMRGYWDDPQATAERVQPGRWPWQRELSTGDLFRRDADGYLFWVGRTDDLIKSRGEKVYPREVEEVLHDLDEVAEAVVVGTPDRLLGEAVTAHVVAAEGHELDFRSIRRACSERLEPHMVPKHVHVHAALPRNPRGKIDRAALLAIDPAG